MHAEASGDFIRFSDPIKADAFAKGETKLSQGVLLDHTARGRMARRNNKARCQERKEGKFGRKSL